MGHYSKMKQRIKDSIIEFLSCCHKPHKKRLEIGYPTNPKYENGFSTNYHLYFRDTSDKNAAQCLLDNSAAATDPKPLSSHSVPHFEKPIRYDTQSTMYSDPGTEARLGSRFEIDQLPSKEVSSVSIPLDRTKQIAEVV